MEKDELNALCSFAFMRSVVVLNYIFKVMKIGNVFHMTGTYHEEVFISCVCLFVCLFVCLYEVVCSFAR